MKKLLLFMIFFFSFLSLASAREYHYDLSDLGNLNGQEDVYIGTIRVDEDNSNIAIDGQFWDNDFTKEIVIYLEGSSFELYTDKTKNRKYVKDNTIWTGLDVGDYILMGRNDLSKNYDWGIGKVNLNITKSNVGNNNNVINEEKESIKIKLFGEIDEIEEFFLYISNIYMLFLILVFLFEFFNRNYYGINI